MTISANGMYMILGIGIFAVAALIVLALSGDSSDIDSRLARVGAQGNGVNTKGANRIAPNSVRSTKDSAIPLLDQLVKALPNPEKLRIRLASTGKNVALGEYLLMNALSILLFYLTLTLINWSKITALPASVMLGLGLLHAITGFLISRRLKKFLANFPEAIDTMCRGIRSGLPITESFNAVGREMPDPIGIEFRRISAGVRMGQSLEASMWEVARRIDTPEFRFLIIAMTIQKETGGNLAETLGNLGELIRKRRQLRLKIKAMSSEAKASAMIIGSLPFIMFGILMLVSREYVMVLFDRSSGRMMLGIGMFWMALGCGVMAKMIHFEL